MGLIEKIKDKKDKIQNDIFNWKYSIEQSIDESSREEYWKYMDDVRVPYLLMRTKAHKKMNQKTEEDLIVIISQYSIGEKIKSNLFPALNQKCVEYNVAKRFLAKHKRQAVHELSLN